MPDRATHVVMLVRNAYTHDSRVKKEASSLLGAGYRVTVVADAAPGLPQREHRDGTDVVRVPRSAPAIPGLRFLLHQWKLARSLREQRPAILHAHDSNALIPVALAARALGIPYVYDAHDLWLGRPRRERSRLYFGLSQLTYRLIERLLIPRAAATLTVSPPIVEHLRRRYRLRNVALVPNYPELPDVVAPRDLRGLASLPDLPIALYLGGLMAGRGLEELVDAVAMLPSVQLVALGEGVLADELRDRAEGAGAANRVHLLPPVPPDEVIPFAASADLGISPILPFSLNSQFSLPNKLFQYMAAGIPVVASDLPQVRAVLDGARCGIVVDTTRPAAIAHAIAEVLADPAEARAMGQRGAHAVAERHRWQISAGILLGVYAELRPPT